MNPTSIARVSAYVATDGKTFTGENSKQRCKDHQADVDARAFVQKLIDDNTDVQDGVGIVDAGALLDALLDSQNGTQLLGIYKGIVKRSTPEAA